MSVKRYKLSPEHKRKIGLANSGEKSYLYGKTGENHPKYGKHLSEETRRKMSVAKSGIPKSEEHKRKMRLVHLGNHYRLGRKQSEETKEKCRLANLGEKSASWKGDNINKGSSLHGWVRKYLKQPDLCQMCNKNPSYDLANITGIYNREFKNWKYFCRKCHMLSDGRIFNLSNVISKADRLNRTRDILMVLIQDS